MIVAASSVVISWPRRSLMNVARSAMTSVTGCPHRNEVRSIQGGADVRPRAQLPAERRLEAPVPVFLQQQPVLQVVSGDQPDITDPVFADQAVHVPADRIETQVEVHGVDQPALLCDVKQ